MTEDWVLDALADVERTAEAARVELGSAVAVLAPVRAARLAGVPLPKLAADLARRGAVPRRAVAAAMQEYEQAVAALRTKVVRALVDEMGVPMSELARRMGVSRQAVSRIYKGSSTDGPEGPPR
jgi:DNA invertase Pin-like site-specific DNA recombinase